MSEFIAKKDMLFKLHAEQILGSSSKSYIS